MNTDDVSRTPTSTLTTIAQPQGNVLRTVRWSTTPKNAEVALQKIGLSIARVESNVGCFAIEPVVLEGDRKAVQ